MDLCTTCAEAALALLAWRNGAHRVSWAALKREVEALVAAGADA